MNAGKWFAGLVGGLVGALVWWFQLPPQPLLMVDLVAALEADGCRAVASGIPGKGFDQRAANNIYIVSQGDASWKRVSHLNRNSPLDWSGVLYVELPPRGRHPDDDEIVVGPYILFGDPQLVSRAQRLIERTR